VAHRKTLDLITLLRRQRIDKVNKKPRDCIYAVSLVKAKKCYHCKVIEDLTNTKLVALQQEYDNLQHYFQTKEDLWLYSANKQQANRFYKAIKKYKKYPLSIRNDLIRIEHKPSTIAEY